MSDALSSGTGRKPGQSAGSAHVVQFAESPTSPAPQPTQPVPFVAISVPEGLLSHGGQRSGVQSASEARPATLMVALLGCCPLLQTSDVAMHLLRAFATPTVVVPYGHCKQSAGLLLPVTVE